MIRPFALLREPATLLVLMAVAAEPSLPADLQIAKSTPGSKIVAPTGAYIPPSTKYVFSVRWQFFNAGTSTVAMEPSGSGLHVTATADSSGMPDKLYRVHDIFNAEVNNRSFCTARVNKHNEEGPHRRDINVHLDYPRAKSEVDVKDLKTSEVKHSEFDIPACVTDVITGFFYVASLPLAPGFSHTFPVNDNGKTTDVQVTVESRDKVKGPTGEYQTLRVKAEPISGAMQGKGTLWVWFTDDARHVPVQMKSKLAFATLLFQLQSVETPRKN